MAEFPRLVPAPPTRGPEVTVGQSPFWIGTAPSSGLRLYLPGFDERHVSILERTDGFWISPARPETSPRVNGTVSPHPHRLRNGDVIELAPGVVYRFDTGERPPAPPPPPPAPPRRLSSIAPAPGRRRQGGLVDRTTRRARWLRFAALGGAVLLLAAAVMLAIRAMRRDTPSSAPLTETDALYVDSLMLVSYERVERGTALLGLGARDEALRQFANAVTLLETSRLGNSPYLRPRIQNLEAAIAEVYRTKGIVIPRAYREVKVVSPGASPLPQGALTVEEFATAVEAAQAEFQARYGRRIMVTGRDHGEHRMLYGPGGALDLRVRDLTREQVLFAMQAFKRRGVRVKDFSDDAVLQAQIASARSRNRPDLMGTGLHMHIDRFANRWDRWTS